jgi:hypothetical protein
MNTKRLKEQIKQSIDTQLKSAHCACFEETLVDLGLLKREDLEKWQKGGLPYLSKVVNTSEKGMAADLKVFRSLCNQGGLIPLERETHAFLKHGDDKRYQEAFRDRQYWRHKNERSHSR